MEESKQKHCKHYQNQVEIFSPCCEQWFPCRLCHDESLDLNNNDCNVNRLDRKKIQLIRCKVCQFQQIPQNQCQQCQTKFASYFCLACRIYENNPKKQIFHCDKCDICIIGQRQNMFHCDNCNICLPLAKKGNHICMKDGLDSACPICLENMKYSAKQATFFRKCGHWIHQQCSKDYLHKQKKNNCPICNVALVNQTDRQIQEFDFIIEQTRSQMTTQMLEKKVNIICNQCLQKSQNVQYHFLGIKCPNCNCYNTQKI